VTYLEALHKTLTPTQLKKSFHAEKLEISSLTPMIQKDGHELFTQQVKTSIESQGLLSPLIVFKYRPSFEDELPESRVETWRHWFRFMGDKPANMVFCGCNRLWAAEELGYTSIDCIVLCDYLENELLFLEGTCQEIKFDAPKS